MEYLIRDVRLSDTKSILDIYSPYILYTNVSFEIDVPSIEAFEERIKTINSEYPYAVCEIGGTVVGYAYASKHGQRAGYRYSADLSIYIDKCYHGVGIGRALYEYLLISLKDKGIHSVYVAITYPNDESIGFHKAMGFKEAGILHEVGYKNDRYLDLLWMERKL